MRLKRLGAVVTFAEYEDYEGAVRNFGGHLSERNFPLILVTEAIGAHVRYAA